MRVSFNSRVQPEVNEAVDWYEEQQEHLGDDFFAEVEVALAAMRSGPSKHSFWMSSKKVRRVKLKRFPYHLLYVVHPHVIRVLSVRHEKRHPNYGATRQ